MPSLTAGKDSIGITVKTTADVSGLKTAQQAVDTFSSHTAALSQAVKGTGSASETLSQKLLVAKQRLMEAEASANTKKSTMMSLRNTVANYESKLGETVQQEQQSNTSMRGLAGAVVVGQLAYSAFTRVLGAAKSELTDSIASANRYQAAILGLTSVSVAFGGSSQTAKQAAKSLASDGLMSVADAATGLKNLLASGFSMDQSIELMKRFKDSAAFGRQSALTFGQAVSSATEGIKNGNSILVDNAGVTKNLSVILEEAGKSQQDVMNISTDASVRQALYNGILKETQAQLGNANQLTGTFAGQQAKAGAQAEMFRVQLGSVVQLMAGGLVGSLGSFLAANQNTIISFGSAAIAAIGAGAAFFGVVKAIQLTIGAIKAFQLASAVAVATNPLLMALTAIGVLAGVVVYKAMGKMQDQVKKSNNALGDHAAALNSIKPGAENATKAEQKLNDELGKIDKQIQKANRDFREQMAEMIKGHQDKVKELQSQLGDENDSFKANQDKESSDFADNQKQQADEHQKKVDDIQKQLQEQTAMGIFANKREVADLQQRLSQENQDYAQQTAKRDQERTDQIAKEKAEHDKKITDLQTQLDQENALLTKHNTDVAGIRQSDFLDEVDKLRRSHQEQLVSFAEQKEDAKKNAGETSSAVGDIWKDANGKLNSQFSDMGNQMGTAMGNAFKQALASSFKDIWKAAQNNLLKIADSNPAKLLSNSSPLFDAFRRLGYALGPDHMAGGGSVSAGQPVIVGDNADGSLNSTSELFVPNKPGKIYSAKQTQSMLGGAGTTENHFHAPIYVTTAEAAREVFKINELNAALARRGMSIVRPA
jgi:hypothetical protein